VVFTEVMLKFTRVNLLNARQVAFVVSALNEGYLPPMFSAFEGDGAYLLEKAGLDPDGPVNIRKLVAHHLGAPPQMARMRGEAELVIVNGQPWIYVRAGTYPARARWLAGHEFAHWWLRESGQEDPTCLEMQCDVLGAILVAPGRAVTRAVRAEGRDPIRIASMLQCTQSLALLRLGETGHLPTALVEVRRALLRGEAYRWPDERTLKRALRQELVGLRRVPITDEPKRVGLLADE